MTSTTAMLSFSVAPPLCHRPCPGPAESWSRRRTSSVSSFEEAVEPVLTDRLAVAGFFRQEDLHEMRGARAHETLRCRAPCQLSRSVSVVTVSTCSPNRFM